MALHVFEMVKSLLEFVVEEARDAGALKFRRIKNETNEAALGDQGQSAAEDDFVLELD